VSEKTLTNEVADSENEPPEDIIPTPEAKADTTASSEEAVETGADSAAETGEPEEEPTLEMQLEAAKAEAAKNLDGWMRVQAEFANAR
jgi:molecular chaperone GrpE (heat shock protein)